ncbi:putative reverse transcriptase domain-containing protein [Tanacetum coccineum]|uniref:Reverse transcriptase domain-containing protein n=1 Tax=Tanacetum coccineum TaxID=301880 RepID=A0ABQ5HZ05_9ASTR
MRQDCRDSRANSSRGPRGFTLRYKNKEYVLDEQISTIDDDSTQEEIEAHQKQYDDAKASNERLDVVKSLIACKLKPGATICAFVLEMKGYFDRLESLNMMFDADLSINIILFGKAAKGKAAKGKSDYGSKRKAEYEIVPTSDPKEAVCFYCNTKGYWKRSCPKNLKDLKDRKFKKGSHSGMLMIELHNTTTLNLWVLDTGCGSHICTVLQGLKESRRLKHGELNLVMGNRKITLVTRIGKYELMLKSGVRIDLNNYRYSLEMTRNIISFHALFKDGYKFSFDNDNGDILVYSNVVYCLKLLLAKANMKLMTKYYHNVMLIIKYGSSNELDKSKLYHSRLGHINKKHITQLRKDGVLELFNFKYDDVCESCLLGKMTKSPFTRSCERGEGLLDLVHTNVCGPFRFATKDRKHYYVTFTNDFNRYGYVYLIKHKSDTFEVFKGYQNEVENQLDRKIKKTAQKDVFMAQPEDFESAKYPKRACKLQKAIYELKQASRSRNLCFHEKVTQFGFSRSEDESCVADALAARDAKRSRNGEDSHYSGTGVRRQAPPAHEYTYPDFMKCKPLYFKGTEGVIELTQWFERMETVFHISKCSMENQIKFATCTLLGSALTWWNSHVKNVGHYSENKRKQDDNQQQQQNKRPNTGKAYAVGSGEKKPYEGSKPLCSKCNYHHDEQCAPKCHMCNRVVHLARDYRSTANANTANNQRGTGAGQKPTCYECGAQGHFKRDCPKLKNNNRGNQGGNGNAPAKVYAVGRVGTNPDSNVITGTFLLNNRYASVLFDTGADRSFVSTAFSSQIDITPSTLDHYYDVELADGRIIGLNAIIRGCTLNFLNHPFNIDLMPIELGSLDVIIGMDWLAKYQSSLVQQSVITAILNDLSNQQLSVIPLSYRTIRLYASRLSAIHRE